MKTGLGPLIINSIQWTGENNPEVGSFLKEIINNNPPNSGVWFQIKKADSKRYCFFKNRKGELKSVCEGDYITIGFPEKNDFAPLFSGLYKLAKHLDKLEETGGFREYPGDNEEL